jgi:anion-transporting  ArsA/GET3 family ATPase
MLNKNAIKMKKTVLTMVVLAFMAGVMFTGCNSPGQKLKNAEDDVVEANAALEKANQEYLADLESYRQATAVQTITNEQMIAELKARASKVKASARADYDKKVNELEEWNNDMKSRLANFKDEEQDNWVSFKAEFSRDMKELGKAISDFGSNSTK